MWGVRVSQLVDDDVNFAVNPSWWTIWSSEWKLVPNELDDFSSVYISYDLHDRPDCCIWYHTAVHNEAWLLVQSDCPLLHFTLPPSSCWSWISETWIHSVALHLSFSVENQSNEWAWIAMAQTLNLKKQQYCHILHTCNTTTLLCHPVVLLLCVSVFVWSTCVSSLTPVALSLVIFLSKYE